MPLLDLREFEHSFVIHFGTELPRVNAYTLASTLVGLADAAKAANAILNPGYEVTVVVEAVGSGSFKATIRTIYSGAQNLFSKQNLKALVLGVIANFVYQHTLAPNTVVTVNVRDTEVVIEQGDTRIVVSREVHGAVTQVEKSPAFRKGVANAIRSVESDVEIRSFGFSRSMDDPEPPIPIPRDRFAILTKEISDLGEDERELSEITDLQIVRAILERSRRRWQFVWNGVRISAPVMDQRFYGDFFAHKIRIAPGDILRVRLHVRQRRHADLKIFINESYEVAEVLEHIPRPEQRDLEIKP